MQISALLQMKNFRRSGSYEVFSGKIPKNALKTVTFSALRKHFLPAPLGRKLKQE